MEQPLKFDAGTSSRLATTDLKIGILVTVSPNLRSGDRSLVGAIWEIAGLNEGYALLVSGGLDDAPAEDSIRARLVAVDEHEFFAARGIARDRLNKS